MKNILGKILVTLVLALSMTEATAQHIGYLYFGTQPAAQAWVTGPAMLVDPTDSVQKNYSGGINQWLYAHDANWKWLKDYLDTLGMGNLLTWAVPNQEMVPDPSNPPFGQMVSPTNTQWRVGIESRVWAALTAQQQYQVMNPAAQNNLLDKSYGSVMADGSTGIRSY